MKLSDFTKGRDNNFNLIRIVAALAVLISHGFSLSMGNADAEPLRKTIGMSLGLVSVDIFFITSGFLVTASLLTRQSAVEFIWARILRIFPALLFMLLLTVFGLGLFFTSLPPKSYLTDPGTYSYLLKCATLVTGVVYDLPGVFVANPYKNAVNGSLWTLPYEMQMYAILVAIWAALFISKHRLQKFRLAIVYGAGAACFLVLLSVFVHIGIDRQYLRFVYMFFLGGAIYVLKERVIFSPAVFWSSLAMLFLAAMAHRQHVFFVIYALTVAYLLFYIAYIPSGIIRRYNKLGDYSYGVYIYAFPVQQSVAALMPGVPVLPMLLISSSSTLLLAVFSWHFLERHALRLKEFCALQTRKLLARGLSGVTSRSA